MIKSILPGKSSDVKRRHNLLLWLLFVLVLVAVGHKGIQFGRYLRKVAPPAETTPTSTSDASEQQPAPAAPRELDGTTETHGVSIRYPLDGLNGNGLVVETDLTTTLPDMKILGGTKLMTPLKDGLAPTEYMSAGLRVYSSDAVHSTGAFEAWLATVPAQDGEIRTPDTIGVYQVWLTANGNKNVWRGYTFVQDRIVEVWFNDPAGLLGPEKDEQWFRVLLGSLNTDRIASGHDISRWEAPAGAIRLMGRVTSLGPSSAPSISIRQVEWVTGSEAADQPNGFLVRNLGVDSTYKVAADAKLSILARPATEDGFAADMQGSFFMRSIAYAELVDAFARYGSLPLVPFHLIVKDGVVLGLQEQYVP